MEHIIWEHGTLNMGIWTTQYGSGDHSNWNGEGGGGVTIKWLTVCGEEGNRRNQKRTHVFS